MTFHESFPVTNQLGFSSGDPLSSSDIHHTIKRAENAIGDDAKEQRRSPSRMLSPANVECPENPSHLDESVRSSAGPGKAPSISAADPKQFSASLGGMLREMLRGLVTPSLIDDANLSPKPEISSSEALQSCAVTEKMSHESHKAPSRDHSYELLRAASTFLSSRDVFEKSLAARRKRLQPDDSDDAPLSPSDSFSNEVVEHVFNFVDE